MSIRPHACHTHRFMIGVLFAVLLLTLGAVVVNYTTTQARPSSQTATPAPAPVIASTEPYIEYAPNTALVKLKAGVTLSANTARVNGADVTSDAQSLNSLLQAFGAATAEPVFGDIGSTPARASRLSRAGLERIYRVQWTAPVSVEHAVAALAADPAVEYAEPDYIARAARTPNDPEYASQWALPKINAPAAWDIATGDPNVIIALVDSGVDTAHPDFAGRLWQNDDPVDGVDNDLNGKVDDTNGWNVFAGSSDLTDPNGHGSEVGGIAGAATDNGAGVAGLCWGCRLMFVNAMQASGVANYSDVAAAVQYAASNGAQVINLSLGGYADSAMLRDAIREAAITTVIVGGAGNDDSGAPFYPAAYPEVLAVAATDSADQKAVFSNYGAWVDVSAPGKDIRTTTVGGYATGNGTSLAAPFVGGLAGLLKSRHPTWTPEQVKWQILNTAVNIDALNPTRAGQLGSGRIDAGAALGTAPQARAAVEGYAIDGQANARPAPGQAFQLVLNLHNLWLLGQGLQGTLSSSDPHVTVTDAAGEFGDISAGQVGSNSSDPFGVTVANNAPYNHLLTFTLNLSGAGGYSLAVPFTVQVRSAVETLSNTIYSQNTTWTSDKTYVLNGSVIVNTGVTLTIQPGTVVQVQPGKFIRVDGTLIAQGAPGQPIVFTNATEGSNWSGIRFTASAVDASFDAAGTYVGGSILQHVEMRHADIGLSLAGRAPYIADSLFADNGKSIQTWADGAVGGLVRIERNRFAGGGIDASGGTTIVQNAFTGSGCGITLQSGLPLIMQNTLIGAGCGIHGSVAFPAVVSNTVQGGGIELSQSFGNLGAPAPLPAFLQGPKSTQVAAGGDHTCALPADGGIQCWGNNAYGQLGNGSNGNAAITPQTVTGLDGSPTQVATGERHTCALLADGAIQCWGDNYAGQLGNGGNTAANAPQTVTGLGGPAAQVAAGWGHTCALLADGGVQCWGDNGAGQLGNGGNAAANAPQTVTGLGGPAAQVAAGAGHTCALLADGGVQCWGHNGFGQLGNADANAPQTVTGLGAPATQVAAGEYHTCARLTDGSIQCWGYNYYGQLGIGGNANANTPQTVTGLGDPATQVAAGGRHSCVLLADGGVQCWGDNGAGQLGNGDTANANTPQTVTGLGGPAAQVAAGYARTCALLVDGVIQCWGWNDYGQLGNGGNTTANTPQTVIHGEFQVIGNVVQQGSGLSVNSGTTMHIRHNSLNANTAGGLSVACSSCSGEIASNTIAHNQGHGIALSGTGLDRVTVHNNNLVANGGYDLYLTGGQAGTQNFTVDATNNFWNVDASQIPNRIRDCTFDDNGCGTASSSIGKVAYDPLLVEPDQTAPAFVRRVTVDPNPVGMQRGTVTVDFSTPMMTSTLPAATFHDTRRGTMQRVLSDTVQAMTQDVLGKIWVGLSTGVSMHNGRQWATYTTANSGLGDNNVQAIYGATNGDVWFGHACCGEIGLSRLSGSTWITYTRDLVGGNISGIWGITQDRQDDTWVATDTGVYRYDGASWRHYTTADGLAMDATRQIVSDIHGHIWVRGFGPAGGLSEFDGVMWKQHGTGAGLPTDQILSLFADSHGRVWVGLGSYSGASRAYVGMYDGADWRFYGSAETNDSLNCDVNQIGERSDGVVWFSSCPLLVGYDNGSWTAPTYWTFRLLFLFDRSNNLWYSDWSPAGVDVQWIGLDYALRDGQWLSSTRFQADYTFDASVSPGFHIVQLEGAIGRNGMSAYTANSASFLVDFGTGVALDSPAPPQVTVQTDGSLDNLSASWQSSSPNIDQYRYAIGTTPGARNVVGWTYLAGASFIRNDLNLVQGQSYYITVQARNTSGLWSVNGVSSPIIAGQASEQKLFLPAINR